MSNKLRAAKYDNLKAILIFMVVFGHMIEAFIEQSALSSAPGPAGRQNIAAVILYVIIYTFHMPAFIYITGKFAKFKKEKIIFFSVLYVSFQILYTVFLQHFYDPTIRWSLTSPQWIMWYLMSTITYLFISLLIPSSPSPSQKKIGISLSFLLSILVGFLPFVGLEFSLSRTLVFFPFFLMGKWEGKGEVRKEDAKKRKGKKIIITFLCGISAVFLSLTYFITSSGNQFALYQKLGYAESGSAWYFRLLLMITAVLWIRFLLGITPDRQIPVITDVGRSTLVVFLGHGFIIKFLGYCNFTFSLSSCFFTTIIIIAILYFVQIAQRKLQKFIVDSGN